MTGVHGIHHVTAIASDPQRNVDFYAGVLGLRLVKRTVNFDDPQTYHLYYGDEVGTPGGIMTFFPWPGARRGRQGPPQIALTSFAVAPAALGFWIERFLRHGVPHRPLQRRAVADGAESVLAFQDPDGLLLELVGDPTAERRAGWSGAIGIDTADTIRGFHGVTLWLEDGAATEALLTDTLGFRPVAEVEGVRRFEAGEGGIGTRVGVRSVGAFLRGLGGPGAVHHVAFRVADDDVQAALRERVIARGLEPTEPIDRRYFRSVYFHEPAGVLFELATDAPGFAVDESAAALGGALQLPSWYEAERAAIEAALPPLHLPQRGGAERWSELV